MNNLKSNHDNLNQLEWLLRKRLRSYSESNGFYEPYYGDVTELNTCRLIMDSVGKDTLKKIAEDAIDLLETSVAVYEINGDYAFGMFSSGWCQLMDTASRRLCHTDDNRIALNCGSWLCHENCWNDSATAAIESGRSTDIQCVGGINLYSEPIYAGEAIVGVINIGYGTPPKDSGRLKELAEIFDVDLRKLKEQADSYDPRPQFLVDLAKKRLKTSANLIGEIVEKSTLQQKLQKSKVLLESTNRMAKVGGWDLDADRLELTWTEETCRIHEVPIDYKPSVQDAVNFFHPEDRPKLELAIQRALDHGEPYDMETRFITAKGKHLWTRTICQPEIVSGKTTKLKGTFQDITDRKQAEAALKKSEEKYRALFESSKDPVYISTLEGTVMDANPSFFALFGYTKDDLGQLKTQDLYVNPDNRAEFIKKLNKSGFVKDYLEKLQSKSGFEMDCRVTATVRRSLDGDIIGYQGTIRDISEVRRKELEKEQLISDLQDALAEVKKLSGLLPICMHCKKIRDDKGYWNQIEAYIHKHSDAEFSHSICKDCAEKYYPDVNIYDDE